MTRILWLIKGLGRGGAERLITTCAAGIDQSRFDVEVAYLMPDNDAFVPALLDAGIKVHCLNSGRDVETAWPRRLTSLLRAGHYDLLHTHSPMPAAVARVAAPRHLPIVHTEHNVWSRYRRATYWANAVTYRRNNAVIAVSDAVAQSIPGRYSAVPVQVVHHGIDFTANKPTRAAARVRAELGIGADDLVLGTVGNLTEKKDHRALVTAFAHALRVLPQARLVIVGSGPLEASLRTWMADAGVTERTVLTGSRDDVTDLLPILDLFVLSSRYEGLSIALIEALAAGVPCVATRVGGVAEVLDATAAGLMVPPGQPETLGAAIVTVLSDDDLRARMGSHAAERAAHFDIRTAIHRLETIYEGVLSP